MRSDFLTLCIGLLLIVAPAFGADLDANEAIRMKLSRPITTEVGDVQLRKALSIIRVVGEIPIMIPPEIKEEAGLRTVSLNFKQIETGEALKRIFEQAHLEFVVQDGIAWGVRPGETPPSKEAREQTAANERITRFFQRKVSIDFQNKPLRQALAEMQAIEPGVKLPSVGEKEGEIPVTLKVRAKFGDILMGILVQAGMDHELKDGAVRFYKLDELLKPAQKD